MSRNLYAIISLVLVFAATALSQETEDAASSTLANTVLPAYAVRILPDSVPHEINAGFKQIIDAGEGRLVGGEREVLAWAGENYKMANADGIIRELKGNLQKQGWDYEPGGSESGINYFSFYKSIPAKRVILGFYVQNDEALLLAWTEVLAANSSTESENTGQTSTSKPKGFSGQIIGTWANGNVSSISEKNLSTGTISSRGGSTFKYVFRSNGTFEFIGLVNSTMYGCTTSLFNDKRGNYEVDGSRITLIPSKNFWRKQNSCAPASNSEQDYKLDRETFEIRNKTDEYGKVFVCLADAKGETCYRKES